MLSRTILLAALLASPAAAGDGLEGLTPAQRAQVADPNNPQFAPPWPPQQTIVDDHVGYVVPPRPSDEAIANALKRPDRIVTGPIAPELADPMHKNALDRAADLATTSAPAVRDVCTRHGLRKVTTHNGRSWKCR